MLASSLAMTSTYRSSCRSTISTTSSYHSFKNADAVVPAMRSIPATAKRNGHIFPTCSASESSAPTAWSLASDNRMASQSFPSLPGGQYFQSVPSVRCAPPSVMRSLRAPELHFDFPPLPPSPVRPIDSRYPPTDPRKTRRHCTDFGLGRTKSASQMSVDHCESSGASTASSTPLGSYTLTGSDDSSLRDIEFDFPVPPKLYPIVRRMRSSPSVASTFDDAPGDFQDLFVIKRSTMGNVGREHAKSNIGDTLQSDVPPQSACPPWEMISPSEELELEDEGEELLNMSFPDSRRATAAKHISSPVFSSRGHVRAQSQSNTTDFEALPLNQRCVPRMRSLRFAQNCSNSTEKTIEHRSLLRGRSISMDFNHTKQPPPLPNLKSRVIPRHNPNLSLRRESGDLGTPFLHRSLQRSKTCKDDMMYRSYIDITPEQAPAPKKKLRKLLARASHSVIIGWSKMLGANKSM